MATSFTTILKLALPAQGELSGSWGTVVNNNITSMIEEAIAGRKVINTWSTNSATLSTADGTTSESRAAMLAFTDTGSQLSGAATVICPAQSKIYICKNSAGQTVTIKTSSGTGVAIPNGETMFVFCDGTNVEQAVTNISSLNVDGFAFSIGGAVTTAGAFTTSGANALTLTTTGTTNVTLPTTGTLATTAGTETFTNKTLTSPAVGTALTLNAQGELRFGDSDTSNYVGFEAPATVSSNQIWVLPAADGSNGQALITNGSGTFSFGDVGGDVVDDTSPQLGGNLDVNGNSIVSTSNADITIEPNGTGDVNLTADTVQIGSNNENATVTTQGTGDLTINTNNGTNSGSIVIADGANGDISVTPNGTGSVILDGLSYPQADGSADQVLKTDGSGNLSFVNQSSGGIASVSADSSPQLGGNLDVNGNSIVSTSNADITIEPNGTGDVNLTADTVQVGSNNENATITTQGTGDLTLNTNNGTNSGSISIADGANGDISLTPNGSGNVVIDGLSFPNSDGSADQVLKTDGSGNLSFVDQSGGGGGGSQVHFAVLVETVGSGDNPFDALIVDFDKQTFNPRTWATNSGLNFSSRDGWTGQNYTLNNGEGTFDFNAPVYKGAPNNTSLSEYFCFSAQSKTGSNITLTNSGNGRVEIDLEIVNIGSSGFIYLQPEVRIGNSQIASFSQTLSTSGSTGTITFTKAGFQNTATLTTTNGITLSMGHWDGGSHANYLDVDYRFSQLRIYFGSGTTHTFDEPTRTFYTNPTTAQWDAATWIGTYYGSSASTNADDYNWSRK
tara:strand:- start:820 stop:3189 length:2370 start_codon:yes stop_codon:yes gene_type:complete